MTFVLNQLADDTVWDIDDNSPQCLLKITGKTNRIELIYGREARSKFVNVNHPNLAISEAAPFQAQLIARIEQILKLRNERAALRHLQRSNWILEKQLFPERELARP